ncbi:MAG: alternative ribosome rescue aminoacyl-tRNA hydrolase ArfB [Candidatus Cyclobacteriaceae bacterium M2_1C_046]
MSEEKDKVYKRDFEPELDFTASRSSGPGGQNVNKVNTKITLRFDIENSQLLSEKEKEHLKKKLSNKISNDNILIVAAESERSQLKNKEEAISKFYESLKEAFKQKKKRKKTKPTKASKEKRIKQKKMQAEKKKTRQKLL